jgi:preprotein translocase subunit SecA
MSTNSSEKVSRTVRNTKQFGRNEKVSVKYGDGKVLKNVKFKKVQDDIESGRAVVVN